MLRNFFLGLVGKQIGEEFTVSKTKLTAIVYVIVVGVQEIPKAFGHPVTIPASIFQILQAAGLWALRDAIPAAKQPS